MAAYICSKVLISSMQQHQPAIAVSKWEKVISKSLFVSDFYQVKHLGYDLMAEKQGMKGFNDCLCMVYVKKGAFLLDYFEQSYDMHSGYILLDKANYDYRIRPSAGACTIFNFTDDFYRQYISAMNLKSGFFFSNQNLLSVMLRSGPETDYLHHQISGKLQSAGKLEMDNLVLELFNQVARTITNIPVEHDIRTLSGIGRLAAVELAREYIHQNFSKDISLQEISTNSFISPFHFSRIFKKITSFSPHQYLQQVRLKHAEMLLKNSNMPVSDIAYTSGFSSTAYFATAFKQQYALSPLPYRKVNRA
jgi:AraC family transcriptional regulator